MTNAVGQCGDRYLELAHNIGEAANFATYFIGSPAAESTPHLYISALATWSQDTSLSRSWKNQFTHIPVFTYSQGGSIDLPLMTISAGGKIKDVAFSSDSTQIVSGSDCSVHVWDASTGVKLKELKGHTNLVRSGASLGDGLQIVSASRGGSVRVWDASTGVKLKKLKGPPGQINAVAFSRDGMLSRIYP